MQPSATKGLPRGRRTAIILHGVGAPGRPLEPGEEVFWLDRVRFCEALDRIVDMGEGAPEITFDDGNASDVDVALPELAKRGLRAIFFLLSGRIGMPGCLRPGDVTELARAGHRIGLHGHGHVDWRRLDAEGRRREFATARRTLADLAGQPVDLAAAPFGLYDRQTARDLRAAGFRALYTSDRGTYDPAEFIRPRNCLEGPMPDAALADALRGRVPPMRRPRRLLGIARKRLLPVTMRR